MSKKETLIQIFHTKDNNFDKIVKFTGLPDCLVELDKDEYSVGEVIQGKLLIKYKPTPHYFSGVLLAVNGKITANLLRNGRKWIESKCNLHLFTYVLRSKFTNRYIVTPTDNAIYVHPFSIKLPTTNLHGSFWCERGSIIYSVQALLAFDDNYQCIGEKIFTLVPYLNTWRLPLSTETLSEQYLSTNAIYVLNHFKFDKIKTSIDDDSVTLTRCEDPSLSSLLSFRKGARFEISLQLLNACKAAYVIGQDIPYRIHVKNPNNDNGLE